MSLVFILFYVVFYISTLRYTREKIAKYKKCLSAASKNSCLDVKTESTPKAHIQNKHEKSIFYYLFEDYKKSGIRTWYFYIPLMDMLKDVLSQLFLVLLGGYNLYQLYLLMAVELFGLALAVCSIRAERGFKRFSKMLI